MALNFLRSCDEVNETRFELLSLVSLGYVLGETLLVVGIDVVGRRPYLGKHLNGRQGSLSQLRSLDQNVLFIVGSQNSSLSVFYSFQIAS